MKVMVLAAGKGERMRPLTDATPKPLLEVGGKPLLAWHFEALASAGYRDVVVNAAYLGQQIIDFCGDGSRWGLDIQMSVEPAPLETAGGIIEALPLLGGGPFVVLNGDVFTEYPLAQLRAVPLKPAGAHLVMVPNPPHNSCGDFALAEACNEPFGGQFKHLSQADDASWTYSGLGVYQADFFQHCERGPRPLKPLLDQAIDRGALTGEIWSGVWTDVGTPQRLAALDQTLSSESQRLGPYQ
ncbi:MAG: nucleotidyltransferase family protein [Halieaceae bacterium]|jgi:MurNAc alpha-1-phosphate uridylyltransferase|nr:nucleotidyltransferase family protein [Halieaceae bacterium]